MASLVQVILIYNYLGYLIGELKKVGISPSLQTNIHAPDPQKIVDLQVSY